MTRKELVQEVQRFGIFKTVQDLGLRGLNRLAMVRILKGVTIDCVNAACLECAKSYEGMFLDRPALTDLVRNRPEYQMSDGFLREAFAKGDECYGILDGPVLAAYGWYSNRPTAIDAPGVTLHFNPRYIYMYKGFTHVKYRGERLHAVAMTRALAAYLAKGYAGLVSYVEWNNFSSLKSCYRMGYRDFGNLYLVRLLDRYFVDASRSCAQYGFHLEPDGMKADEHSPPAPLGAQADQSR